MVVGGIQKNQHNIEEQSCSSDFVQLKGFILSYCCQDKVILMKEQANRLMEGNGDPRDRLSYKSVHLILNKKQKHTMEQT